MEFCTTLRNSQFMMHGARCMFRFLRVRPNFILVFEKYDPVITMPSNFTVSETEIELFRMRNTNVFSSPCKLEDNYNNAIFKICVAMCDYDCCSDELNPDSFIIRLIIYVHTI